MKITVAVLAVVGAVLAAGSAQAETRHEVRVNVPFAFVVGNKVLPPGNYTIDPESSPVSANEVLIQNVDHPRYAVLVRGSDEPGEALPISAANRGRLVFNQYGDDRFLREIRGPYAAINVEVPKSRAEQHVEHREMARVATPAQTTIRLGN